MMGRSKFLPCLAFVLALLCCAFVTGCASHQGLASTGSESEASTSSTVPEGARPGPSPKPTDNASANASENAATAPSADGVEAIGSLSFTLEAPEWVPAEDEAIVVRVFGQSAEGELVDQQYTAAPGQKYLTSAAAGDYEISLLTGAPVKGHRLFKAQAQRISFDGKQDANLVLTMSLDTDAMKSRQSSGGDGQKTRLPGMAS